MRPPEVRL